MKIISGLLVVFMFLAGSYSSVHAAPRFLNTSDRQTVELGQLIDEIALAEVIFIGETHDDKRQHEAQLDIIRSLHSKKIPVAIAVEMFAADNQLYLDYWSNGKVPEQAFKEVYARNWSYEWQLYRDIFIFARDNHIPLIALNAPKLVMAKVVRLGAKALDDSDKKELPPRIDWELNPPQTEYLRRITAQVFGNRPGAISFANFAEAQALRNNAFAWNIARYREKSAKGKIVVIAGTWHAIKSGAPEQLKRYGNPSYRVILPALPELEPQKATANEADYFLLN